MFLDAKSAIFQVYRGKNKLFEAIEMNSVLDRHAEPNLYRASALR